jgi:hypothetical protein
VVDLALVFDTPPRSDDSIRLSNEDFALLAGILNAAGLPFRDLPDAESLLAAKRRLYEPYVQALARHLRLELPPWIGKGSESDNWQTSAWEGGHL